MSYWVIWAPQREVANAGQARESAMSLCLGQLKLVSVPKNLTDIDVENRKLQDQAGRVERV